MNILAFYRAVRLEKSGEVRKVEPGQVTAILFLLVVVFVVGDYLMYRGRKKKPVAA